MAKKSYRPTRKQKVFDYLYERGNSWVPGYELTTPEVGGTEGLRRLRELREEGIEIEMRPIASSDAYEYRLVVPKEL